MSLFKSCRGGEGTGDSGVEVEGWMRRRRYRDPAEENGRAVSGSELP